MEFEKGDYVVIEREDQLFLQEVLGVEEIKGEEVVVLSGTYLSKDKKVLTNPILKLVWPGTKYQYCIKKELVDKLKRMGKQEYIMEQTKNM